jgi:hypothetical protein
MPVRRVRVVEYPQHTRQTNREYTHAVIISGRDRETQQEVNYVFGYCSRLDLAQKQRIQAERIYYGYYEGRFDDLKIEICNVEEIKR